ncbi:hypothetical protein GNY06_11245 [Elizabethkingia argentiflava]|uniref:Uncharacterized protein n=1 Tax=Elizabethkingia argenteiflava TaxID=2681556 RepID=A0A845PYM3_9FLAO|nr:hypothetical protein [Elizabethkingia argenteiflava]NAW51916.1 hypothetical protein [Elizabethkingia argenteiflava]
MKSVEIKAEAFFELLKQQNVSMWDIFEKMIDEKEEKRILFFNKDQELITSYILPCTLKQLKEDKKIFNKTFSKKLSQD